jgi:hypothetical protein
LRSTSSKRFVLKTAVAIISSMDETGACARLSVTATASVPAAACAVADLLSTFMMVTRILGPE